MRRAFIITFISKYSNLILQFSLTMLLSRLLTPSAYGVVAIVSVFTAFFQLMGDMGIGPAIIQYKKMSIEDVNYIFKFTIIIALLLSTAFYFFSYIIGWFFNDNIYQSVGQWMSIGIFFTVTSIVPKNILYRDKRFLAVGIVSIVSCIISGTIAVIYALFGGGVYALVVNMLIQSFTNLVICLYMSRMKILIFGFNWEPIRKISSFSIYQFLFNFVNYFTRNIDNFIVGKLLGTRDLGYYDRAYRTAMYPLQGLTYVINPVLQPILSDYVNNRERIYKEYLKVVYILSLLGALIVPICFFNAKEIIFILFGNQWYNSIIPFKLLSISIGVQLVLSTVGTVFQATEKTKYMFYTGLISSITFITLSTLGIIIGKSINCLSTLLTIGFFINFFQNYYVLIKKVFHKSFFSFLIGFRIPALITTLLFIENFLVNVNINNYFFALITKSAMIFITYLGLCIIFGQWDVIKKIILH